MATQKEEQGNNLVFEAILTESANGFDDYDVKGHPVVHRVCPAHDIKTGDIFNAYCEDGIKIGVAWRGGILASLNESAEIGRLVQLKLASVQVVMNRSHEIYETWDSVYGAERLRLQRMAAEAERLVDEARETLRKREERLAYRRDALRVNEERFPRPHKREGVLVPFMDALRPYFEGLEPEIYGPFGLASRYSLTWKEPGQDEDKGSYHLSVEVEDGCVRYVDYTKSTNQFSPNTIGAINGLNYEAVKLPATMLLSDVAALFKKFD